MDEHIILKKEVKTLKQNLHSVMKKLSIVSVTVWPLNLLRKKKFILNYKRGKFQIINSNKFIRNVHVISTGAHASNTHSKASPDFQSLFKFSPYVTIRAGSAFQVGSRNTEACDHHCNASQQKNGASQSEKATHQYEPLDCSNSWSLTKGFNCA